MNDEEEAREAFGMTPEEYRQQAAAAAEKMAVILGEVGPVVAVGAAGYMVGMLQLAIGRWEREPRIVPHIARAAGHMDEAVAELFATLGGVTRASLGAIGRTRPENKRRR